MTDAMRSMLDELMGKERNAKEKQRGQMNYDDQEVWECEYEVHEDHIEFPRLKAQYDALPESTRERLGYSRVLVGLLDNLVKEMDRKIAKAKERVEAENRPRPIKAVDQARLDALKQQEKECLEKSESMAMEGDADGSMAMTETAEKLREEHDKLHTELVTPERTMSVCEVCGVFINSTDNEQRRLDHINGKQYVGWKRIREKLQQLNEEMRGRRTDERERERPPREDDRHGGREGGRPYDRYDDRDRDRGDRYGARGGDRSRVDDRNWVGRGDDRRRDDRYADRHGDRHGDRGTGDRYGGRSGGDRRYGDARGYRRDDRDSSDTFMWLQYRR